MACGACNDVLDSPDFDWCRCCGEGQETWGKFTTASSYNAARVASKLQIRNMFGTNHNFFDHGDKDARSDEARYDFGYWDGCMGKPPFLEKDPMYMLGYEDAKGDVAINHLLDAMEDAKQFEVDYNIEEDDGYN